MNMMRFSGAITTVNHLHAKKLNAGGAKFLGCILFFVALFFSAEAPALSFVDTVSSGYSSCSYTETDTVATFKLKIHYAAASTNLEFYSRGVVLYSYDGNGVLSKSSNLASTLTLNGVSFGNSYQYEDYTMYYGTTGDWKNSKALIADIQFTVLKSKIASWPAVGVRAGTFTLSFDILDKTGLAYIGPSTDGSNKCTTLLQPGSPPPAVNPKVTMTAPDWDLGELPRGKDTILTLPASKDQLCFTYVGSTAIANQKYLINATNINGLSADNRYLLKSLEDSSQTVPYTLTLANGSDSVLLPNTQSRLFSLGAGGRTCFTPTFRAQPDKAVKGGAYSDILTFTVVAKP